MIHLPERVKAIRDRAAADLEAVTYLEAQTKDPGFRQRLQLIRHQIEDIELFFLATSARESRTPEQEAQWLDQAEKVLNVYLAPQIKEAQEDFDRYGPAVTSS
jgi:hypothetical protein